MDPSDFVPGYGDLRLIGRGATAAVFEATSIATGATVAVKVLNVLLDEAQTRELAEELTHRPHVAHVLDVVAAGRTAAGHPWLVMAYLERRLADEIAEHGRLGWERVVAIGLDIAEGLAGLQNAGIVHGEIAPARIRLDGDGAAWLADGGLARYAGAADAVRGVGQSRLAHSAPEVVQGRAPDARSEVYSLASTLYEALSGVPPLGRLADQGAARLVERILSEVPTSLVHVGVPEPVADVIATAMAKEPSVRPATAAVFRDALVSAAGAARRDLGAPLDVATASQGASDIDDIEVLSPDQAAVVLAQAGRRHRRRRRLRQAAVGLAALVAVAALVVVVLGVVASRHRSNGVQGVSGPASASGAGVGVSAASAGTVADRFSVTFDRATGTARLTGQVAASGAARLVGALAGVTTVSDHLQSPPGTDHDGGTAVSDAATLLVAMVRDLARGTLSFDGTTLGVTGTYRDAPARADLISVIEVTTTPVARPQLTPAGGFSTTTTVAGVSMPFSLTATPSSLSVPADGAVHVFPISFTATGSRTGTYCLATRSVSGPPGALLVMNYSSCTPSRFVTVRAAVAGTYTVTDVLSDGVGPQAAQASVVLTVTAR